MTRVIRNINIGQNQGALVVKCGNPNKLEKVKINPNVVLYINCGETAYKVTCGTENFDLITINLVPNTGLKITCKNK